jgi:hypothetical protein
MSGSEWLDATQPLPGDEEFFKIETELSISLLKVYMFGRRILPLCERSLLLYLATPSSRWQSK